MVPLTFSVSLPLRSSADNKVYFPNWFLIFFFLIKKTWSQLIGRRYKVTREREKSRHKDTERFFFVCLFVRVLFCFVLFFCQALEQEAHRNHVRSQDSHVWQELIGTDH